ncbi:MAG: succinylglutamate desuccinylase/aspartoacylase family protein [Myxococcales bacterium]|nr:succinylglutamate desuccinylase/aspartoacylase family protein [Myxococcales bacterium]
MNRDETIGATVNGRPIEAIVMSPPSYARPRPPAVVFGAIHGDEPATRLQAERLIEELLDRPPGRETWIIPVVNVDGLLTGTKNNARDVDLNRNFAATSWVATHPGGYSPGPHPESEPETQALAALIARTGAERLIALHATYRVMNWDGRGQALAEEMGRLAGYPAAAHIGYPTPGSFGARYGHDLQLEVVTVEVPYLDADERAWTDTRTALRWAVDLPT